MASLPNEIESNHLCQLYWWILLVHQWFCLQAFKYNKHDKNVLWDISWQTLLPIEWKFIMIIFTKAALLDWTVSIIKAFPSLESYDEEKTIIFKYGKKDPFLQFTLMEMTSCNIKDITDMWDPPPFSSLPPSLLSQDLWDMITNNAGIF